MNTTDPTELLVFARDIAEAAGQAILPHFRAAIPVEDKGGVAGYDPVTVADRAAESVIRARIAARHPDHGIRGEEHGWQRGTSAHTWVIDPIDGTRSFILGQLHWATLIALHDGERVVAGVAHQPFVGESFLATVDGPPQWRRGEARRTLATRRCRAIEEAVVATTHHSIFRDEGELAAFHRVADRARLTRYGGDCYAYCLLAMGLIDIVIESSLHAYDVQALIPIVETAGGIFTSWTGGSAEEGGQVLACGDRALHQDVLRRLNAGA